MRTGAARVLISSGKTKMDLLKEMEKKSVREIVSTVFKALTLAMGVAVMVLSCMGSLDCI